jgi:hypothetical protein
MEKFRSWPKKKYLQINTYQCIMMSNKAGKIMQLQHLMLKKNQTQLFKSKLMRFLMNFFKKSFLREVRNSLNQTFFMEKFLHKWIALTLMRLLHRLKVRELTNLILSWTQKSLNKAKLDKLLKSYPFWTKPRITVLFLTSIILWTSSIAKRMWVDFWNPLDKKLLKTQWRS